jgi:hypothetical protein
MKSILLAGLLFSTAAWSCPDLTGTYVCQPNTNQAYQMEIKTDKMDQGAKYTFIVEGETMSVEINPKVESTDEFGIASELFCEQDKVVATNKKDNLFARTETALVGNKFVTKGQYIAVDYEVDQKGNVKPGTEKYSIQSGEDSCDKLN